MVMMLLFKIRTSHLRCSLSMSWRPSFFPVVCLPDGNLNMEWKWGLAARVQQLRGFSYRGTRRYTIRERHEKRVHCKLAINE